MTKNASAPTRNLQSQPHSLSAEGAVLGALLVDPEAIIKIADTLHVDHFYDPIYRTIYEAILELHSNRKPIDFITIANMLESNRNIHDIGGSGFLASLPEKISTASNIQQYADIVVEKAIRREYLKTGQAIIGQAYEEEVPIEELREYSERELLAVATGSQSSKIATVHDQTNRWNDRYCSVHGLSDAELAERYVISGYPSLDKMMRMSPGDSVIVAGRTSMGKTAFAINLALNVCAAGKTVVFFTYEMTEEQLMDRIVAGRLGVTPRTIQDGKLTDKMYQRVGKVLDEINGYHLYLDKPPNRNLNYLLSRARRHYMEHGIDLMVVDYLQKVETTATFAQQNRVQMVSHVSNSIKALALELNIPIVSLAQLSRKVEERPDKIPKLSDLRESGDIEQDADSVLMFYREDYYHDTDDDEGYQETRITDIFCRKQRSGAIGKVQLHFNKEHMTFSELERNRTQAYF